MYDKKSENLNASLQWQLAYVIVLSGPITSPIRQEKEKEKHNHTFNLFTDEINGKG